MSAMSADLVSTLVDGSVATLTLTRDHKRNALDQDMCRAIDAALDEVVDAGARAIVITGDGSAFCAGADLGGGVYADGFFDALFSMLGHIQRVPAVVIGAINGPAVGAGTQLAMACDLRVVADAAYFRVPVVDVAIALDDVTVRSLERLVGGARARTMLLTGATLSSEDAVSCGFAAMPGTLDDALALASVCATKAPLTLRNLKAEFAWGGYRPFSDEERREFQLAAWNSEDVQEARAARAEKREAEFRGR